MSNNKQLKPNRREILKTGLAAGAATLVSPFVANAQAGEDVLYVNTWGGTWEESARLHLFDPFTADTGIEIRTVSPVSLARLAAQVRSNVYEFDVSTLGVAPLAQAKTNNLIETTEGAITEEELFPGAISNNGIASHAFGNCIVTRTDMINPGPQNWAEFWDVENFPGDRSLQNYAARVIGFALLADGVPKADLFPYDLDRAFASLDKIKPHVVNWWSQGPQSTQMLRDGEVATLGMWPQYASTAIDEGTPGEIVWDECIVDTAYWVVAKGTPRAEMGWEFIKSAVKAERVGPFASSAGMGPVNPASIDFVDPAFVPKMPTAPQYKDRVIWLDAGGIADQLDEMERRFADWLLS